MVHGGYSENASECFLHDLDHWAAHKVFNLSSLCKAELIFLAVRRNSICAKLQREVYAWNPSQSLFSLLLCSVIPSAAAAVYDLVISLLIYNKWTLSWLALWVLQRAAGARDEATYAFDFISGRMGICKTFVSWFKHYLQCCLKGITVSW